jgi:Zn finger protein HypA/HybF involved in hydrogenase expression
MSYVRCKECGAEYEGAELFFQCPDCDAFESFELVKENGDLTTGEVTK